LRLVNVRALPDARSGGAVKVIKTGKMGPERTIAAIRDYISTFLDASLLGAPTNLLLMGPSREYPEVEVTTPEQPLLDRK
jgi:hypothetical protein